MSKLSFRNPEKRHMRSVLSIIVSIIVLLSLTACGEVKDAETLIAEAVEYQQKGDDNAAIIQLKNALQQEPNHKEARYELGVLLQKTGDLLAAEKELERALSLGADANAVLPVLSRVLFDLGKFRLLLDTIERFPDTDSVEVRILQGRALLATGRQDESKALLDQVLSENPDSTEVLVGLAQHALSEQDIESANALSRQAIEKNPDNSTAWLFYARLLQAQNKTEQALKAFTRVIQLQPDNLSAYSDKATLEINLRQFDDAQSTITQAKQIAPENVLLNYSQALLDFNQGRHAEALSSIQTLLSVAPEHLPSVLLAGAIQLSLGSLMQAEQYLEQYLKKIPGNIYARKLMVNTLLRSNQIPRAITILEPTLPVADQDPQLLALAGETYMRAGDFVKAAEYYEKANELVPNNATIHTALGMTRLAMGDQVHGIAELELASELDKNSPRAGILLALAHIRSNEFDKAHATIDELLQEDKQNPLFYNLKGVAFIGKEEFSKAREIFNQALAIQSDFFPAISNLARLDIHEQKPDVAKGRFQAILQEDDRNIPAMHALASLAAGQNNTAEATRWLEMASNKNPNELEPALQLVVHYLSIDDKEKALLLARKLNGTYPNEPRVLEVLGRVQIAHSDLDAALDSFERLAAQLPDSAPAQLQLADIHARLKDPAAATSALRKALHIDSNYIEAKLALIRLAVQDDKLTDAMSLARNLQQQHADVPHGYVAEGDLWVRQNKPDAALKAYEKAFSIAPSGALVTKMHRALTQAGDAKKAHAEITQWLTKNPDDALTRLYLANDYLSKQQYAEATKAYEFIVERNPQHLMSLNNLAWLYQQGKDPRALELAEKASRLAPQDPSIQDTLAWILVEKGEIDRALPMLEKASVQMSDNLTIQYHYAFALAKAGDREQARRILSIIVADDNTDFPEIDEAKSLLTQLQ